MPSQSLSVPPRQFSSQVPVDCGGKTQQLSRPHDNEFSQNVPMPVPVPTPVPVPVPVPLVPIPVPVPDPLLTTLMASVPASRTPGVQTGVDAVIDGHR
jgi:hypothetical protein